MRWKNTLSFVVFLLLLLGILGCAAYVETPAWTPWHPRPAGGLPAFYDDLAPWGEWLYVDPWGWVWTPWDVEPGWRPYTDGRWVWTSLGWTWVSELPWGWVPFHYGRWTYHTHYGWLWVPGTVWAPAWVAWRSGHGWIGWAPLPPQAHWHFGIGLDLGDLDLSVVIVEHGWSFVDDHDFLHSRVRHRLAPLPRNAWLLRETRDRTRYEEREHRVATRSFEVEELEKSVGAVPRYRIEEMEKPPRESEAVGAGVVRVYRPPVKEEPAEEEPSGEEPGRAPERRHAVPSPQESTPGEAAPPPAKTERQDERKLKAWEQQERKRLEEEQKRERREPPAGEGREQVEQRQKEEKRALDREVEREKKLQESRRDRRAREGAEGSKPEQPTESKERDKGKEGAPPPGGPRR